MKNIYFVGKAGAGKTYCGNYLRDTYGYQTAKFAYPVYNIGYDYFKMNRTLKDRKLLQIIGTEGGRAIDKDIWVNRFLQDMEIVKFVIEELNYKDTPFVLDDCRFPNEHEALAKAGWIGIYLDVDDEIRLKRLGHRDGTTQSETLQHSSETSIDLFKDKLIKCNCNGSLEETYTNLEIIIITEGVK